MAMSSERLDILNKKRNRMAEQIAKQAEATNSKPEPEAEAQADIDTPEPQPEPDDGSPTGREPAHAEEGHWDDGRIRLSRQFSRKEEQMPANENDKGRIRVHVTLTSEQHQKVIEAAERCEASMS